MLAWALWLALALLRWLRWAWESLAAGGGWRPWPSWRPWWRRKGKGEQVAAHGTIHSPVDANPPAAPDAGRSR